MRTLLLTTALAVLTAAPAFAQGSSLEASRDAYAASLRRALGASTLSRVRPVVASADEEIGNALRALEASHPVPRPLFDPAHRDALDAVAAPLNDAIAPVLRSDGRRIDAMLTPAQRSRINALRLRARGQAVAAARDAGVAPETRRLIDDAFATPGRFVIVVESDPHAFDAT